MTGKTADQDKFQNYESGGAYSLHSFTTWEKTLICENTRMNSLLPSRPHYNTSEYQLYYDQVAKGRREFILLFASALELEIIIRCNIRKLSRQDQRCLFITSLVLLHICGYF